MNLLLCLGCPAIISLQILSYLNKKELSVKRLILSYFTYFLLINFFCAIISVILFNMYNPIESTLQQFSVFAIKYLSFAIIFSILIPIIEHIITKNIEFSIEIRENKNEKHNK